MGYVFGYRRVSSVAQSYARQTQALLAAGVPEERIYEDKLSGRTTSRPGLDALISVLRPGDEVVVSSMDRLGRTALHILQLLKTLNDYGVTVRSLKPGEQFDGVTGKLMLMVMLAIAEWERENTRERAAEGRAARAALGEHRTRRKTAVTKENISAVKALRAQEMTIKQIAQNQGISRASVYRCLEEVKS